jgi:hypothetical protein
MMHAYFCSLTSYFLNAHIITPLAYEESFSIIKRLKNAARCKEDCRTGIDYRPSYIPYCEVEFVGSIIKWLVQSAL